MVYSCFNFVESVGALSLDVSGLSETEARPVTYVDVDCFHIIS